MLGRTVTDIHSTLAASRAAAVSPRVAVPSTLPRSASVAWATGLRVAAACIHRGMVSSGANALDMNMSGIISIIPANCTTSGRRNRSPMRPNNALIARGECQQHGQARDRVDDAAVETEAEGDGGKDEDAWLVRS